jgi:FkbM family methyltransferase
MAKYAVIIKHLKQAFRLGRDSLVLDGRTIFYDSKFGLAGYQSMLSRHQYMLQVANIQPREIGTVIDCGANVGFFSMMIHDVFPKVNIYAIEPVPAIYACLKGNAKAIPKIRCFDGAISDTNGVAKMSFDEEDSVTSKLASDGDVEVRLSTLDDFCKQHGIDGVDILKIDTESFEAHVLRGAKNTLAKTKYLFLEVTLREHGNYTISSLMSLLYSPTYNFQLVAYRNYTNKGEGHIEIMDCLLRNEALFSKKADQ